MRCILGGAASAVVVLLAVWTPAQAGFPGPASWQSSGIESREATAVGGALAEALEAEGARLPLTDAERDAMAAFYAGRGNQTLWVTTLGLSDNAKTLLRVLREAPTHALPADDHAAAIEAAEGLPFDADQAQRARVEVDLTAAALLYGRYASAGRVVPQSLGKMVTYAPKPVDPGILLGALGGEAPADRVLEGLYPDTADYRALRAAFLALSRAGHDGEAPAIPDGAVLKPGMSDARVAVLRSRLVGLGVLDADLASEGNTYGGRLVEAVKAFQRAHGLADDGVVGPNTVAELNQPVEARMRRIAASMERMRWMPDELGKTYVLVQETDYRMSLVEDGEVIHSARVIVGKPNHQTPEFADEIDSVVLNPYWNVPRSIVREEFLPVLRQDPTAAQRGGFEMFGPRDAVADPRSVDWRAITGQNLPFSFRQPPGRGNALGQIKFLFPNQHSVYMHDTPSRGLFAHERRAFSHGCVRLQNPLDLAEILLGREGWTRAGIERAIATGRNQHVALTHKVPVYLAYWTAFAGKDGQIEYREDVYDRDRSLLEAMGVDGAALKMANLTLN